jgi:hypothetical protein
MTISTFADLKSQVATFLNRSNLTSQIPYYVQLAETRIAYGSKEPPFETAPLRVRAMETRAYATFNAQSIQLPTGYLQQRRLYLAATPNGKLNYETPDSFWTDARTGTSGQPVIYTVEGEAFYLAPTPDTSYTGNILYYKKFTALSADADTNWILANAPNVYLYGTLLEAFSHIRNMEQAQLNAVKFAGMVNALNSADKADRHVTPWTARSDTTTP